MTQENPSLGNGSKKSNLHPDAEREIFGVSGKITTTLSPEGQEELRRVNERLKFLLDSLSVEVSKKSYEIGYNYEQFNYVRRLMQPPSVLHSILYGKILSCENIFKIIDEICVLKGGIDRSFIIDMLYEDYFEDLVYELIDNEDKEKHDILKLGNMSLIKKSGESNTNRDNIGALSRKLSEVIGSNSGDNGKNMGIRFLAGLLPNQLLEISENTIGLKGLVVNKKSLEGLDGINIETLFSNFRDVEIVEFVGISYNVANSFVPAYYTLLDLSPEQLDLIFKNLNSLRNVNLGKNIYPENNVVFSQEFLDKLLKIFGNFKGVRILDISENNLGKLPLEGLEIIFSNLNSLETLSLSNTNLGDLGEDELEIIFSNLTGLKNLDLSGNDLSKLGFKQLKTIFKYLKGLRTINLNNTNLGKMGASELEVIFSNLEGLNSIELLNDFKDIQESQLKAIFGNLRGIKSINFLPGGSKSNHQFNLHLLSKGNLEIIFSNLKGVKNIDLSSIFIHHISKDKLEVIFNNLRGVKGIKLSSNLLGTLDKESLEIIFNNLRGVKNIDLSDNSLWELDKERLEIIFGNINGVKDINISKNDLGKLGNEELRIIFSNLKGLNSINLLENNLGSLSDDKLNIIFSSLRDVKSILLKNNNLTFSQKKYIKSLQPNINFVFGS